MDHFFFFLIENENEHDQALPKASKGLFCLYTLCCICSIHPCVPEVLVDSSFHVSTHSPVVSNLYRSCLDSKRLPFDFSFLVGFSSSIRVDAAHKAASFLRDK